MNDFLIEDLYNDSPERVTFTDEEFKRRFRSNGWRELLDSNNLPVGGESRVYFTNDGLYVIKTPIEYDVDSGERLTDSQMEEIFETKYDQLSLEFMLPNRHPNITTTLSVSPKYTAELRRGKSLMEHIESRGKPTLRTRLNMCLDIFTGLKEIHKKSAAHLDIKPENIFVNDGRLSIGDFGSIIESTVQETGASIDWSPHRFSSKRPKDIDMYSTSMVCIGILAWKSDIISQCGHFRHALNRVNNMENVCSLLIGVFDDTCFFPEEKLPENFVETLKNGLLGLECGKERVRVNRAIQSLHESLRSIS